jgi:hypothetical protein
VSTDDRFERRSIPGLRPGHERLVVQIPLVIFSKGSLMFITSYPLDTARP